MGFTEGEWEQGKAHTDMVYCGRREIAHCYGPDSEANARLIAAGPELYGACKELLKKNEYGSIRLPDLATRTLEQAVAKVDKGDFER